MAFTMVTGGNDTTTGLLGVAADLLTQNLDQRAGLLADSSNMKAAVEEFLRLSSPVQGLARTTTRDVEIGDRKIPAGRKVMLLYASGNRDEREFGPTAADFDMTRKIRRHLTFGYGAHHCIGAAIARLQVTVALEELLARCPNFVVDSTAAPVAALVPISTWVGYEISLIADGMSIAAQQPGAAPAPVATRTSAVARAWVP